MQGGLTGLYLVLLYIIMLNACFKAGQLPKLFLERLHLPQLMLLLLPVVIERVGGTVVPAVHCTAKCLHRGCTKMSATIMLHSQIAASCN